MTIIMKGIQQKGLFSGMKTVGVYIPEESKYRILSEELPWLALAEVANRHRSKRVDIMRGAPLDLRLHLGAYIAQTMNGWTDRMTEEQVRYHAGVRLLCGVEGTIKTIDHTSIEDFRNTVGAGGAEELNAIIVRHAAKEGFTGSRLCSSDTTVQEAPIVHPTEVGHLRKIVEKLAGIGRRVRKGIAAKAKKLQTKAEDIATEIRLFTRGKKETAVKRKKELGKKLHRAVSKMYREVEKEIRGMTMGARAQYEEELSLYRKMLGQIWEWMRTGYHPAGKVISLWYQEARAITRGKAAKAVEFGMRWIITRLENGYVIGRPRKKLGSETDGEIAGEVLSQFKDVTGKTPRIFVYDRGGDDSMNHKLLKQAKVKWNCIFRKRKGKMEVGRNIFALAKRERALAEAAVGTIKCGRYQFNKPRARSGAACITKGQMAILGSNMNRLLRDLRGDALIAAAV